jgi:hypothetical protein
MSWRDDEIDDLFKDAADRQSFEFRSEYFEDIEKLLPIKRSRKPFFWWFTSSLFLVTFIGWGVLEGTTFEQKSHESETVDQNLTIAGISGKDLNTSGGVVPSGSNEEMNSLTQHARQSDEKVEGNEQNILKTKNNGNNEPKFELDQISDAIEEANLPAKVSEEFNTIGSLGIKAISTGSSTPNLGLTDHLSKTKRPIQFYLEIGGGIGQGWVSSDPSTVNGNAFINGGSVLSIGRLQLSAGLGVRASKLGNLQIMERTKIYGLGYSTYENQYTFRSFYSVEAPINVNYQMGRHAVGVGVVPSFNLCTGLTRTEWIDGVQMVQRSGVSNVGLFSKAGITGTFGYAYSVNETTQIGVRGGVQLIQPLSSDRFVGTSVKMPLEGQVYLRRTFDLRK